MTTPKRLAIWMLPHTGHDKPLWLCKLSEAVKVLNLDEDKIAWRLLKRGWFNTDHYHVAVVDLEHADERRSG
jgi:hypothetical protein